MSQSTQDTLQGIDSAEFLSTSIRTQLPTVSPLLAQAFRPPAATGEGEVALQFDWDQTQTQNAEIIDLSVLQLQEASKVHKASKILFAEAIRERREGAKVLRSSHRSFQKLLASTPESQAFVGLDVPLVRPMLGMREQYVFVYERFLDPSLPGKLATEGAPVGGSLPDVESISAEMKTNIDAFAELQTKWTQAKKVRDEAYVAKQAARKHLRRIVVNVARVQEGYYRLAGLDELADRIRLTIRGSKSKKQTPADPTQTPHGVSPGDGTESSASTTA